MTRPDPARREGEGQDSCPVPPLPPIVDSQREPRGGKASPPRRSAAAANWRGWGRGQVRCQSGAGQRPVSTPLDSSPSACLSLGPGAAALAGTRRAPSTAKWQGQPHPSPCNPHLNLTRNVSTRSAAATAPNEGSFPFQPPLCEHLWWGSSSRLSSAGCLL